MLRFRVLGALFSRFRGLRFLSRVLRFQDLGASFSKLPSDSQGLVDFAIGLVNFVF